LTARVRKWHVLLTEQKTGTTNRGFAIAINRAVDDSSPPSIVDPSSPQSRILRAAAQKYLRYFIAKW
jgi:hypothetical protein